MSKYKCEVCHDTGWYGDLGPGIRNNNEYTVCECQASSQGVRPDDLDIWFGLSYASFLVLPRVLMNEMPHDWQRKMARLLDEYDEQFPNQPDIGTRVQATKNGKLIRMPEYLKNYRRPIYKDINRIRGINTPTKTP